MVMVREFICRGRADYAAGEARAKGAVVAAWEDEEEEEEGGFRDKPREAMMRRSVSY
jgi:hypothetical protein